jgi:hypothetical protein
MPDPISSSPVSDAITQALAPNLSPQIVANIDAVAVNYNLPDFIFGGAGLMAILFFHGLCIALIYPWYSRRCDDLMHRRAYWRVEMLFLFSMFLLMMTHLGEITLWALIVHQLGLIDTIREALTFCGSTYTTVGYNGDLMPEGWKMMTMIIALSGMFSFAWTTGIMMLMLKPFHAAQYARKSRRDPQQAPFSANPPKD